MKILFIVPGAGDKFYCSNCLRDNLHASALKKAGHDIIVAPLYLPVDKSFETDNPVFFPAAAFYVENLTGDLPRWIERILGSDSILKLASSFSGTTTAEGTESMTLSMIIGNDKVFDKHVKGLLKLIADEKPEIIQLSSSLLIGIAKAIKKCFDIPIVCALQDEEVWIDSLKRDYIESAWNAVASGVKYIDKFITSSEFYKSKISSKIPEIKNIDVVYPGVDVEKFATNRLPENPTIGFFYRMNQINGLEILCEAFVILKQRNSVENLKLKIGGGYTNKDKKFLRDIQKILSPYINDVYIDHAYSPEKHSKFYRDISLVCVPVTFDEAFGIYIGEAFAAGRPAVAPSTGSFVETVDGGGTLYYPNDSDSLADAIEKMLTDTGLYNQCRNNATEISGTLYNGKTSANRLIDIYRNLRRIYF